MLEDHLGNTSWGEVRYMYTREKSLQFSANEMPNAFDANVGWGSILKFCPPFHFGEIGEYMNSKQIGDRLGILALAITVALLLTATFLIKSYPYKPNRIMIVNPYPCVKNSAEWINVDKFNPEDSYHICGYISSQNPDLKAQIDIRVYENRITQQKDVVFYDVEWIRNGDVSIPINTYLDPGIYVVQIADGRLTLAEIELQVVEK